MITANTDVGLICRSVRASGFKLALVVGYSTKPYCNKLKVSVWRAASSCWTNPVLVDIDKLGVLVEADHKKHAATIKKAAQAALGLKLVGRVWS